MTDQREAVARAIQARRQLLSGFAWDEMTPLMQSSFYEMADAAMGEREVRVKPGVIERAVWSAMVWARENPASGEVPEYTDGGNSFAETEARAAARRIRSALKITPREVTISEAAQVLMDACIRVTRETEGREMSVDERRIYDLGAQCYVTLRALAKGDTDV